MPSQVNCILCGASSNASNIPSRALIGYSCPFCGEFFIYDLLPKMVQNFEQNKIKVACVFGELHLQDADKRRVILRNIPKDGIDFDANLYTWNDLLARYPSNSVELFNRAFLNLTRTVKHPMDYFNHYCFTSCPTRFFCETESHALSFENALYNSGFIIPKLSPPAAAPNVNGTISYIISAKGWEYANSLKIKPLGGLPQVFVAMSFDPKLNSVYDEGIEPAIKEIGLTPRIMRGIVHNEDICATMLDEIYRSKIVIVDCTLGNQGAFFEGGYAKALGKPVIFTVRKGHEKDMHFDTNHYHHVIYENEADLAKKLVPHLRVAMLENQS